MYKIRTSKSFDKYYAKLSPNMRQRVMEKIEEVAVDPYRQNNNLTKLQGNSSYRLRIGDLRVLYEIYDNCLIMMVLEIGPRGEIYK